MVYALAVAGSTDTDGTESGSSGGATKTLSLGAGAAGLFLLLRVMAISHWDWHTAFAVADVMDFSDAISIIYGTLFAEPVYTGILVMWLLPLVAIRLTWPVSHPQFAVTSSVMLLAALGTCTVALVITFDEWWVLLGAMLIAAVLVGLRLAWRRGNIHRVTIQVLRTMPVTGSIGALILSSVVTAPWTPLEHIRTDAGVLDAYTIKVESGYLRVLTENRRHMKIIPRDQVKARS